MKNISGRFAKWKVSIAVIWLVFTFSLIFWWWIYSLNMGLKTAPDDRTHRMFFWEGLSLLFVIFLGGAGLIFLSYKDQKRHERMKLFFSSFSHDIKTSLSRIRLQAEILAEDNKNSELDRLLPDIHRLELSLENSLAVANLEDLKFKMESFLLSRLLNELREEYSDLKISLNKDVLLNCDLRMLLLIFRNIFSNSRLHGKATEMKIHVNEHNGHKVISFIDNGNNMNSSESSSKNDSFSLSEMDLAKHIQNGSGLGLFLSEKLLKKLNGEMVYMGPVKTEPFATDLNTTSQGPAGTFIHTNTNNYNNDNDNDNAISDRIGNFSTRSATLKMSASASFGSGFEVEILLKDNSHQQRSSRKGSL